MSNRKVRNGTPIHAQTSLCKTCRSATHVHGFAESEESTYCNRMERPVLIKVHECSDYSDKRIPALYQMEEIAWTVATDKSGKKIGFMSPSQLRKAKKEGKVLDDDGPPLIDPF